MLQVFRSSWQKLAAVCVCAGSLTLLKGTNRERKGRDPVCNTWSQTFVTILQVYKALWQKQTIVAVKVMREQTEKAQQAFLKEIEVLCSLRHPNVVSFYGAYAQVRHPGNVTGLSGSDLSCSATFGTLTWCQACTGQAPGPRDSSP